MKKLVIGGTVLLLGIAMIVLPGSAILVIPAGLAILATEFIWARRTLGRAKGIARNNERPVPHPHERDASENPMRKLGKT